MNYIATWVKSIHAMSVPCHLVEEEGYLCTKNLCMAIHKNLFVNVASDTSLELVFLNTRGRAVTKTEMHLLHLLWEWGGGL